MNGGGASACVARRTYQRGLRLERGRQRGGHSIPWRGVADVSSDALKKKTFHRCPSCGRSAVPRCVSSAAQHLPLAFNAHSVAFALAVFCVAVRGVYRCTLKTSLPGILNAPLRTLSRISFSALRLLVINAFAFLRA
jgi:hypothetical protein